MRLRLLTFQDGTLIFWATNKSLLTYCQSSEAVCRWLILNRSSVINIDQTNFTWISRSRRRSWQRDQRWRPEMPWHNLYTQQEYQNGLLPNFFVTSKMILILTAIEFRSKCFVLGMGLVKIRRTLYNKTDVTLT